MEQGKKIAVEPRAASTVLLIREHDAGFQVYLLKRSSGSVFFPAMYVFPGGTVDAADRDARLWQPYVDMGTEEIDLRLGGGLPTAETLAHGVAALRETYEEAGVLLAAGTQKDREGSDAIPGCQRNERPEKGWLQSWAVSSKSTLSLSRLARWSHWITPEAMKPRFDTRFFIAFVPPDQKCAPDALETTRGIWVSPEEGLSGNLGGKIPLSPPTIVTLHELLAFSSLDGLKKEVENRPWGEARRPRFMKLSKGSMLVEPWDPMYDEAFEVDAEELEASVLPVGEPFSRLWSHDGLCRPVAVTGKTRSE